MGTSNSQSKHKVVSPPLDKVSTKQKNADTVTEAKVHKESIEHKEKPHSKPVNTSTNELLAFGYIRDIEVTLTNAQIVPLSIIQMIMTYYYTVSEIRIILSTTTQRQTTLTLQYIDFQQNQAILFNITNDPYNSPPTQSDPTQKCFIKHITPQPRLLENKFLSFFNANDRYSAIVNDAASIMYFKTNDMDNSSSIINAFHTNLPYHPSSTKRHCECIYSEAHGLISFDGKNLFQLPCNGNNKWKWKALASTSVTQCNASLCWIKKYSFESSQNDKLFICGGDEMKTANIFNIKNKTFTKLNSMPNARTRAGSYYDFFNQRVYIGGGGHGSSYSVDCYDVNNDRWMMHPDTLYPHSLNPILWIDGYVLFICGHQGNIGSVEMYDIRSNANHWSLADKTLQIDRILIPCEIERVLLAQY